jgi:hypothetical protein
MARYVIKPMIANRFGYKGRVLAFSLELQLSFGPHIMKLVSENYREIKNEYRRLREMYPFIEEDPGIKVCLVCHKRLAVHILCEEHEDLEPSKRIINQVAI